MPRFVSAGSISWAGIEFKPVDGVVEVPPQAAADLAAHGLREVVEGTLTTVVVTGGLPVPKRRGRPPKIRPEATAGAPVETEAEADDGDDDDEPEAAAP